jgi:peptidoglycan/xylan/chitin deacetylase (PgdA/CDA1 family)
MGIRLSTLAAGCKAGIRLLPGARGVMRMMRKGSLAIVMYHGVTGQALEVPNWCQLSLFEFERQIEFLASEFEVISLGDVIARLEQGLKLPDHAACITFDDGFRNVATTAFPVLQSRRLPSSVFLVTEGLGTGQPAWPDLLFFNLATTELRTIAYRDRQWSIDSHEQRSRVYRIISSDLKRTANDTRQERLAELMTRLGDYRVPADSAFAPMNWDEVERLSASGLVEFGSHTHTHPILSRCPSARQIGELRRSRDILRDRLGRADSFAYPNGGRTDFTNETKRLLQELGYRCALSTIPGLNRDHTDRFELRRVNVGSDLGMTRFERLMTGF